MHIFQQLLMYSYEMQDKYRQLIVRFSACLSLSVYASDWLIDWLIDWLNSGLRRIGNISAI